MSRRLTFECSGAMLAGTLHPAPGSTAVLIVAGGVQTRHGSHRGFVALAKALALAGYPVLRFDRRGVGDSDGDDPGFRAMQPDIAAAAAALRNACPQVTKLIGWGLCDGATALALDHAGFDGLILANPWTRDDGAGETLPPRAAIGAHYAARLASPRAWLRLLQGGINLRKLAGGLGKLATPEALTTTANGIAAALAQPPIPLLLLLAARDATAQAFAAALVARPFRPVRERAAVVTIEAATHTFPGSESETAMIDACLHWLAGLDRHGFGRAS